MRSNKSKEISHAIFGEGDPAHCQTVLSLRQSKARYIELPPNASPTWQVGHHPAPTVTLTHRHAHQYSLEMNQGYPQTSLTHVREAMLKR